ncbi:hypothetical protein KIV56_06225 [Cryobacterium breve]|uniref:Uncharacterized protein n=1 Tax=Cryobacterium breve TaxID=1259258 RepID=A0ABY7NEG1_9MICO|nr:hypothetical protein [Cryobacterium breve]WBM80897.1 hypothetical protein KIV56_06225 [Cryobacterium breve]
MPQQDHPTDNVIDLAARRADREAKRPAAQNSGYGEWRAEVKHGREVAASEAYAESLRETGGIRSVGRGTRTWHQIPKERRADWGHVLLGSAPRALGELKVEPRWREYGNGETVRVALGFEDAGFTPEHYFRLRQALHAELLVPDAAPKLGTARRRRQLRAKPVMRPHPLVTVAATSRSFVHVLIEASDWAPWLALVRSGLTPRAAVRQLLYPSPS